MKEEREYQNSFDEMMRMLSEGPQIMIPLAILHSRYKMESKAMFGSILYEITQSHNSDIGSNVNETMPELVKTIMKSKSDSEIMLESVCTEENIELVRKEVMDLADNVDYNVILTPRKTMEGAANV